MDRFIGFLCADISVVCPEGSADILPSADVWIAFEVMPFFGSVRIDYLGRYRRGPVGNAVAFYPAAQMEHIVFRSADLDLLMAGQLLIPFSV